MSKIDNLKVKRAHAGKALTVAIGAALLIIGALSFLLEWYIHKNNVDNRVYFADAYNEDMLKDDIYVCVDVTNEPYEICYYDKEERYYYVSDGYDLYIVRCSEKEYNDIVFGVKSQGTYEIIGTVTEPNDEVMDLAFEYYNEGEEPENVVTRKEFDDYFMGAALLIGGQAHSEGGFMILGIFAVGFGLLIFGYGLLALIGYNKAFNRLSDVGAQVLESELDSPQTVYLKNCNTYLTPRYIVSMGHKFNIVPYSDILWAYRFNQSYNFMTVLTNVKLFTRNFETLSVADMSGIVFKKDDAIAQIFDAIHQHNPETCFGYTDQLQNHFNSLVEQANINENAG